jgi:prevent-host-death family protein
MTTSEAIAGLDLGPKSVGVRELRQSASQILDRVKMGDSVIVTEHGRPVARLVPVETESKRSFIEEYVEAGLLIPAEIPWDGTWPDPMPNIYGINTTDLMRQLRDEERY